LEEVQRSALYYSETGTWISDAVVRYLQEKEKKEKESQEEHQPQNAPESDEMRD
jgi:hypothetical protein